MVRLSSSTSVEQNIDLSRLLNQYKEEKVINVPANPPSTTANKQYRYTRDIDMKQPLWIEVNRKANPANVDKRILIAPPTLGEEPNPRLHLRGFITHEGSDSAGGHYIAYYQKLNYETGEYAWYQDNDQNQSGPQLMTPEQAQEASKLATHVYYEPIEVQPDDEDNVSVTHLTQPTAKDCNFLSSW